jgi:hypothetical protein
MNCRDLYNRTDTTNITCLLIKGEMEIPLKSFRASALATAIILLALVDSAAAAVVTLSGLLNDSANAALVGSGPAPSPALFGNDLDIANNVALYPILVPSTGSVQFHSNGFAAGGVDPYFTLFSGTGNGATFVGSNFAQAISTGGDFLLAFSLAAGSYTVALGVFENLSFAENLGSGSLGDGFIGLGEPASMGTSFYELVVTTPDGPGPPLSEPSSVILLLLGLAATAVVGQKRIRSPI